MFENEKNEMQYEVHEVDSAPEIHEETIKKEEKKYTRRVGTITFGAALIFTGVIIIMSMFGVNVSLMTVLKLSPILLVAFGVEIILSAIFIKDAQFKYDIFGIFLSFILVAGSIGCAFVAKYGERYMKYQINYETAQTRIEDDVEKILAANEKILDVHVYIDGLYDFSSQVLYGHDPDDSMKYITVELKDSFEDNDEGKLELIKDAQAIAASLDENGLTNYELSVNSHYTDESESIGLSIENEFQKRMEPQELLEFVY